MATTSTIPTVKAKLVELFEAQVSVPVFYAWPGPNTPAKCVFLGRHPELDDIRIDGESELAAIQAGRKSRTENYTVPVTAWSFRPDLDSSAAQTCEEEAFTLAGHLEDVVADDATIGLGPGVQWVRLNRLTSTLFPFQKGWACELQAEFDVQARLT